MCCKPNVLRVAWDKSAGKYVISGEPEQRVKWNQAAYAENNSHHSEDNRLSSITYFGKAGWNGLRCLLK